MLLLLNTLSVVNTKTPSINIGFQCYSSTLPASEALAFIHALYTLSPQYDSEGSFLAVWQPLTNHMFSDAGNNFLSVRSALALVESQNAIAIGSCSGFSCGALGTIGTLKTTPILSPSCLSTSLTDKQQYPFFLRTVETDANLYAGVAALLKKMNWNRCLLLKSDDVFGQFSHNAFTDAALSLNITIERQFVVAELSSISFMDQIASSIAASSIRVVVLAIAENNIPDFIKAGIRAGIMGNPEYVFVGGDTLVSDTVLNALTPNERVLVNGNIAISPGISSNDPKVVNLKDSINANADIYYNLAGKSNPGTTIEITPSLARAYDAVDVTLRALNSTVRILSQYGIDPSCLSHKVAQQNASCLITPTLRDETLQKALCNKTAIPSLPENCVKRDGTAFAILFGMSLGSQNKNEDRYPGIILLDQLYQTSISGISGKISFNNAGERTSGLFAIKNSILTPLSRANSSFNLTGYSIAWKDIGSFAQGEAIRFSTTPTFFTKDPNSPNTDAPVDVKTTFPGSTSDDLLLYILPATGLALLTILVLLYMIWKRKSNAYRHLTWLIKEEEVTILEDRGRLSRSSSKLSVGSHISDNFQPSHKTSGMAPCRIPELELKYVEREDSSNVDNDMKVMGPTVQKLREGRKFSFNNRPDLSLFSSPERNDSERNDKSCVHNPLKDNVQHDNHLNTSIHRDVSVANGLFKNEKVFIKRLICGEPVLTSSELLIGVHAAKEASCANLNTLRGIILKPPECRLVWSFVEKGSLETLLKNGMYPSDWLFDASICLDIAKGIQYIHHSGIQFHGRLKTAKCLITNMWTCKLTDFGLHKLREQEEFDLKNQSSDDEFCGSPVDETQSLYTSPELIPFLKERYWSKKSKKAIENFKGKNSTSSQVIGVVSRVATFIRRSSDKSESGLKDGEMSPPSGGVKGHSFNNWIDQQSSVKIYHEQADIYSLGILFIEVVSSALIGHRDQLSKDELNQLLESLAKDDFDPIGSFLPQLQNGFAVYDKSQNLSQKDMFKFTAIVKQCLQKNSSARCDADRVVKVLKSIDPSKGTSITESMRQKLDLYAKDLEALVLERTKEVESERMKMYGLIQEMLPKYIADKILNQEKIEPEYFECVTVFFSDIVGFTKLCSVSEPVQIVNMLNELFIYFDEVLHELDVIKIETIGDAYMAASGVPKRNGEDHVAEICLLSMGLLECVGKFKVRHKPEMQLQMRCGINSGPVMTGVTGKKVPHFSIFGDTVNTAARMESSGLALRTQISADSYELLRKRPEFTIEERGVVQVKGKADMKTYWLTGHSKIDFQLPNLSLAAPESEHTFK